jgi:putative transcriptional regulator
MMARRKAGEPAGTADEDAGHRVRLRLDVLLAERGMTLAELSRQVGVSQVNLSVLKNGHARAIRFSTLTALCDVLGCTPGDLLEVEPPR